MSALNVWVAVVEVYGFGLVTEIFATEAAADKWLMDEHGINRDEDACGDVDGVNDWEVEPHDIMAVFSREQLAAAIAEPAQPPPGPTYLGFGLTTRCGKEYASVGNGDTTPVMLGLRCDQKRGHAGPCSGNVRAVFDSARAALIVGDCKDCKRIAHTTSFEKWVALGRRSLRCSICTKGVRARVKAVHL
jgi:hypothetical protein